MSEIGKSTFRPRLRAGAARKVKLLARKHKIARSAFHKSVAPHNAVATFRLRRDSPFDIAIR
jgi:hypothetical protein